MCEQPEVWKRVYDSSEPHREMLPTPYAENLDNFQVGAFAGNVCRTRVS